jgi:hypothetical protein
MVSREYRQAQASLGFAGGPGVVLRLNPNSVQWNFTIDTSVTETVGGRVVQVLGATISDLTVSGSFGEKRGAGHVESRTYADQFLTQMQALAAYQSRDSSVTASRTVPAVFNFPSKGWRFAVYIKALGSKGGPAVMHKPGSAEYDYSLTMMIQADLSETSVIIGSSNGVLDQIKDKAVQAYIDRIADGIGWKFSDQYNGHGADPAYKDNAVSGASSNQTIVRAPSPANKNSPTANKPLPIGAP